MPQKLIVRTENVGTAGNANLSDVIGLTFSTNENGYQTATVQLSRPFGLAWNDVALNTHLSVLSGRGDKAWEGRVEGLASALSEGGAGVLNLSCNGYWSSTYDLTFNGVVSASASPETMIATFINSTYLPQLTTGSLLVTGLTTEKYQTGNYGTNDEFIGDIILAICKSGYAPGGTVDTTRKVVPAVWKNRGLSTSAVLTTNPTADYILRRKDIVVGGLRRALTSVKNRVIIRYKDTSGALARVTVNDTASQSNLAGLLDGTPANFVRSQVLDYTGLGNLSLASATDRANITLSNSKQLKTDSDNIQVARDYAVFDVAQNQEIPLWRVRAGKWLQVPDMYPRATNTGSTTQAGNEGLATYYYITQTTYDAMSGLLTLIPEQSARLGDLVS